MTAAALGALALPATAGAGGFATVGLSSLPDGTPPGGTWHVRLTILQHGRTPLSDLTPVVRIRNGTTARSFTAKPAGRPGLYTASVVFPSAGRWRYAIDDGFTQTHDFAPATIGTAASTPPAKASAGGANVGAAFAAAAAAGLVTALLAAALERRRRPDPAPEPAAVR
jgi:hypothetical protein